tara:strand:- start:18055 stop:19266 length:1212 start_codon:yes stop_codon:yes gene_type:complete
MHRGNRVLSILIVSILLSSQNVSGESAVTLGEKLSLSNEDLGLNGLVADDIGESVVVYGSNGYLRVLNVSNPANQIELIWPGSHTLIDGDFHPRSETALIVGEGGIVLRYAKQDHSVERAAAESSFMFSELTAVSWNTGGSWAYIGSEYGELWRMRVAEDGGAETHSLNSSGDSKIMDIDCHISLMMCVVVSSVDGIGIIERDHTFSWVGGNGYSWTGIECPDGATNFCVAVADNKILASIELDPNDISKSIPEIRSLPDVDAYFVDIDRQYGDRTIISLTPSGLIEHDISINASFPWLENSDIDDLNLTSSSIIGIWSTGANSGWIVTNRGFLFEYKPPMEYSTGLIHLWATISIPLTTLLVILSLILYASPKTRMWFSESFSKKEVDDKKIRSPRRSKKKK